MHYIGHITEMTELQNIFVDEQKWIVTLVGYSILK